MKFLLLIIFSLVFLQATPRPCWSFATHSHRTTLLGGGAVPGPVLPVASVGHGHHAQVGHLRHGLGQVHGVHGAMESHGGGHRTVIRHHTERHGLGQGFQQQRHVTHHHG